MAEVISMKKEQDLKLINNAIAECEGQLSEIDKSTVLSAVEKATKIKQVNKKLSGFIADKDAITNTQYISQEDLKTAEETIYNVISDIIHQHDIHYVADGNSFAVSFEEKLTVKCEYSTFDVDQFKWRFLDSSSFFKYFNKLAPEETTKIFWNILEKEGRKKVDINYARQTTPSTLNCLKMKPVELVDEPQHWIFDALIFSVCGGKKENIEHLEKCLVHKWRDPGEITIPWLVFNDGGGTGKSLFAGTVLSNLLGSWVCAPNLEVENIVGAFHDALYGKVIGFINEKPEDSYDHRKLLAFIGSEKKVYNPKGLPAFDGDNLMWGCMSSNNSGGTVKLANNDSDRRFSIIAGNEPLEIHVSRLMNNTKEEAKEWIIHEGQWILRQTNELGKYMNSLVKKWGKVTVSRALHGEDYNNLVGTQKSLKVQTWEKIFLDADFKFIRKSLAWEYYTACAKVSGQMTGGRNNFYKELGDWLRSNVGHIQLQNKIKWAIGTRRTTTDIFTDVAWTGTGTFTNNDDYYFEEDRFNNKKWLIEII